MRQVTRKRPSFGLKDENQKNRIVLDASKKGTSITLSDANGQNQANIGAGEFVTTGGKKIIYYESTLTSIGPTGDIIWQAPK